MYMTKVSHPLADAASVECLSRLNLNFAETCTELGTYAQHSSRVHETYPIQICWDNSSKFFLSHQSNPYQRVTDRLT